MGGVWARFYSQRPVKVLLVGLDAAGKTTMLYRLKLGEVVTTIPTIDVQRKIDYKKYKNSNLHAFKSDIEQSHLGFNVETVEIDNAKITMWDTGSREKMRPLWRHYIPGMNGLIYVVDSTDRERLDESAEELYRLLPEIPGGTPILVVANKQDLDNHMTPEEIYEKMRLYSIKNKPVYMISAVATTGEGLVEGLTWLTNAIAGVEAGKDVNAIQDALMQDHSEKAKQGWQYAICGLGYIKSLLGTTRSIES